MSRNSHAYPNLTLSLLSWRYASAFEWMEINQAPVIWFDPIRNDNIRIYISLVLAMQFSQPRAKPTTGASMHERLCTIYSLKLMVGHRSASNEQNAYADKTRVDRFWHVRVCVGHIGIWCGDGISAASNDNPNECHPCPSTYFIMHLCANCLPIVICELNAENIYWGPGPTDTTATIIINNS